MATITVTSTLGVQSTKVEITTDNDTQFYTTLEYILDKHYKTDVECEAGDVVSNMDNYLDFLERSRMNNV